MMRVKNFYRVPHNFLAKRPTTMALAAFAGVQAWLAGSGVLFLN